MTNETIGSKGPDLDQRRRYPAPTIDLTATEIAASTSPRLHPKSGSPDFGPSSSLSKSETSDFDREVDAQSASGEGGVPESPPLREAPQPDPLSRSRMFPTSANVDSPNSGEPEFGAGGETERTESAGGNDPPNGPPWRDWTFAQWSRAASAPFWRLVGAGAARCRDHAAGCSGTVGHRFFYRTAMIAWARCRIGSFASKLSWTRCLRAARVRAIPRLPTVWLQLNPHSRRCRRHRRPQKPFERGRQYRA